MTDILQVTVLESPFGTCVIVWRETPEYILLMMQSSERLRHKIQSKTWRTQIIPLFFFFLNILSYNSGLRVTYKYFKPVEKKKDHINPYT